ncbi:MAG: tyrosine-type recombinase/integrase [Chloroflexi bacterium]|nr:tyrosine-type recombinase/integrase [Chloroflexota bacterium]
MKSLSPGSEALYAYWGERFQRYLERDGADRPPTPQEAQAFLASLKLRPNTLAIAARALRRLYDFDLPSAPVALLEPQYLSLTQVKELVEKAPSLLERTLVIVLFSSAARISEVLNLHLADLELDLGVATVTRKGGRRERINLGKQGTEALREWLAWRQSRSPRVFMDYTYQDIYRRLRKLGELAGIPGFHPHLLRHSRVMHLRLAGREWADISEVCGHTSIETTVKLYGRRKAEDRAALLVDF